jgi:hypothetical protein
VHVSGVHVNLIMNLLLKSERLLVVLEKPLSKLLPEVYEENNENILTNKIVTKNNFKIKQKNC